MLYRLEDGSGLTGALLGVQRQAALRFPTAAQRAAQIVNPEVGMLTFRADAKAFEWWDGTVWAPLVSGGAVPATRVRANLNATAVTATEVTQATLSLLAQPAERVVRAEGWLFGAAMPDASCQFVARLTHTLTAEESSGFYFQRDPPSTTPQQVYCSTSFVLPAGQGVTILLSLRRTAGPNSTFTFSSPGESRWNRLEVVAQ